VPEEFDGYLQSSLFLTSMFVVRHKFKILEEESRAIFIFYFYFFIFVVCHTIHIFHAYAMNYLFTLFLM